MARIRAWVLFDCPARGIHVSGSFDGPGASKGALVLRSRSDVRSLLRRLYRDVWAYEIPSADEKLIRRTLGSSTYGELLPSAVEKLLDYLQPTPKDVFFDLGAGVGKVVVQAALCWRMRACVGVELSATRHAWAKIVVDELTAHHRFSTPCEVRNEDMLTTELRNATIVYTCSTAFTEPFMDAVVRRVAGLGPNVRFVTLQDIDPHPAFREITTLRLDTSWRRGAEVHVYSVHHGRRRTQATIRNRERRRGHNH